MQEFSATPEQIAWFAGLFEGEGTLYKRIDNRPGRHSTTWHLSLAMSDDDIIQHIQSIFGGNTYCANLTKKKPTYKTMFQWSVGKTDLIFKIVSAIYPYMGQRRAAKMDEFLAFYANRPSRGEGMKRRWAAPGYKDAIRQKLTAKWEDPKYRESHIWCIEKAITMRHKGDQSCNS